MVSKWNKEADARLLQAVERLNAQGKALNFVAIADYLNGESSVLRE